MSEATGEDECGGWVVSSSTTTTASTVCSVNLTENEACKSDLLLDLEGVYNMNNKRRGLALIFNYEYFYWQRRIQPRDGTTVDRYKLVTRLRDLNFEVKAYDNYKKQEVFDKLHEAAEADHSDADCFVLVFLSHGKDDHVDAFDEEISIEHMTSLFREDKCRTLSGKPKIFIFQACRGDKHDEPVTACDVVDSKLEVEEVVEEAAAVHTSPGGNDFIMCYSVAEGYYSHRNNRYGSWYIQDLCELLQKYGESLEFTELLTLVNRKVSMRSVDKARNQDAKGKKQVPCFASMLTKKLFFRPKNEPYVKTC